MAVMAMSSIDGSKQVYGCRRDDLISESNNEVYGS